KYSGTVSGKVDKEAVEASVNAGKALAGLASEIPESGGFFSLFTGDSSLKEFGSKLVPFGEAIAKYSGTVSGKVDKEAVEASVNAGKALVGLASEIPESGGFFSLFTGDSNLKEFGSKLVPFGEAIAGYSGTVSGKVDKEAVESSVNAGKALAGLASEIPESGGFFSLFTGDSNLKEFGSKLVPFGEAIAGYSGTVSGKVDKEAVEASVNAGKALVGLASEIPESGGFFSLFTGDSNLKEFGSKLVPFGEALAGYSGTVSGKVDKEAVESSVNAGKALAGLASEIPESGGFFSLFTGEGSIGTFGKNLITFGESLKIYYESVKDIVGTKIYMAVSAANSIINVAKGIAGMDMKNVGAFGKSLKIFGESGVDGFVKAFIDSGSKVSNAAKSMIDFFVKGMNERKTALTAVARDVANAIITALRNQYRAFHSAGCYLVDGFANGIRANTFIAKARAIEMAKAAEDAANKELEIHSPSKVFELIGSYVARGFAQGISKNAYKAAKAAKGLAEIGIKAAEIVMASLKDGSSVFDEFVEKTDKDGNAVELTLERAAEAFRGFRNSIKESIKDAMGVFDEWEEETEISGEQLMDNLKNQILRIREWAENIQKLAGRGVAQGLLKVLSDMGPSSAKYTNALIKLSDKKLRELNALYQQRLKLDGAAANEIASSFLHTGTAAADAFYKGLAKQRNLSVEVKESIRKSMKGFLGSTDSEPAQPQFQAVVWMFERAVSDAKSVLAFGKGAFQKFVDGYLSATNKMKVGNKAIKTASKAIEAYGKKLYEESEQYKEDTANIKEHKAELSSLQKYRDKLQKQLKKAQKSNTAASKKRVKELKEELAGNKKAIEAAKKQIKEDEKEAAAHTKEVFNGLRSGLADSVSAFLDPLKASLDTGVDLFEKFGSDVKKVSTTKLLRNMKSQIEGVENWRESLQKLAEKGLEDGLLKKLEDMGPDGAKYVDAFIRMTEKELEEANSIFAQSESMASDRLIGNLTSSMDAAQKWADGMQELAKMGFAQSLLEQLGDMGVEGYEYLNAFLNMTPEQVRKFNKKYADSLKLPKSVADQVISSFAYAGGKSIKGFAEAVESLSKPGTEENGKIVKASDTVGKNICDGIKAGLKGGSQKVSAEAVKVVKEACDAAASVIGNNSRKTHTSIQADVNGICVATVNTMRKTIGAVSDILDTGMDFEPVICPVLDLSGIQNGAGQLNSMMDGCLEPVSVGLAQMLSNRMAGSVQIQDGNQIWESIDRLKETVKGLADSPGDTYNNTFNIQGSSPREIADEVSHIIQQQVERRKAAWG
ncbi:hypothetical protein AALC25_00065, partial [Lachnospiraceae bacterium 29-84]